MEKKLKLTNEMNSPTLKQKRNPIFIISTWILFLLMSFTLYQCEKDTYEGETKGVCPEVVSSDPTNVATNVVTTKIVNATFNEEMVPVSINEKTFTIMQGAVPVAGVVTYANKVATFTTTKALEPNKVYTATISKKVKDPDGNYPLKDYTWSFSTGNVPWVVSTDPNKDESDVSLNKSIVVTFSTAMNPSSINTSTFIIYQGLNPIKGTVTYSGLTATFIPENPLIDNLVYTGTITAKAVDTATNAMISDYQWSFSTIQTKFSITLASDPSNGGSTSGDGMFNKNEQTTIVATSFTGYTFTNWTENGIFASANPSYVVTATSNRSFVANFATNVLTLNTMAVNGTVTRSPNQANYNFGTLMQLTATPNVGYIFNGWSGDITGSANPIMVLMDQNKTITANYILATASWPDPINLGVASSFAILAGSGIANTGVTTMINGNVGSFPTATINGLLPGNVNGTLYTTANPIVGLAKVALDNAFAEAQSRSLNAISLPGQLGGLTLAPGLYVNSTTSGISGTGPNGILTLDAGGNANAVWIFKVGSTFITDAGTKIVLAGGAQAKNIYWSVGTSATLGTNSIFYGIILADQAITLTTGATLNGVAYTRIAAVTLDSNTITKP